VETTVKLLHTRPLFLPPDQFCGVCARLGQSKQWGRNRAGGYGVMWLHVRPLCRRAFHHVATERYLLQYLQEGSARLDGAAAGWGRRSTGRGRCTHPLAPAPAGTQSAGSRRARACRDCSCIMLWTTSRQRPCRPSSPSMMARERCAQAVRARRSCS